MGRFYHHVQPAEGHLPSRSCQRQLPSKKKTQHKTHIGLKRLLPVWLTVFLTIANMLTLNRFGQWQTDLKKTHPAKASTRELRKFWLINFGVFLMQPKLSKYPGAALPASRFKAAFQDLSGFLQFIIEVEDLCCMEGTTGTILPRGCKGAGRREPPGSTVCLSFPFSRHMNNHSHPLKELQCLQVQSILLHTRL